MIDALSYAGSRSNLSSVSTHPAFRFVHGDITDAALVAQLFQQEQIDCVVHFAVESHVDRSITGPDEFIRTHVLGTHELLKAARAAWERRERAGLVVRGRSLPRD